MLSTLSGQHGHGLRLLPGARGFGIVSDFRQSFSNSLKDNEEFSSAVEALEAHPVVSATLDFYDAVTEELSRLSRGSRQLVNKVLRLGRQPEEVNWDFLVATVEEKLDNIDKDLIEDKGQADEDESTEQPAIAEAETENSRDSAVVAAHPVRRRFSLRNLISSVGTLVGGSKEIRSPITDTIYKEDKTVDEFVYRNLAVACRLIELTVSTKKNPLSIEGDIQYILSHCSEALYKPLLLMLDDGLKGRRLREITINKVDNCTIMRPAVAAKAMQNMGDQSNPNKIEEAVGNPPLLITANMSCTVIYDSDVFSRRTYRGNLIVGIKDGVVFQLVHPVLREISHETKEGVEEKTTSWTD